MLIISLLIVLVIGEYLLGLVPKSVLKKLSGILLILAILGLSFSLLIVNLSVFSILVFTISLFRILNIARLIDAKKQAKYLKNIYLKTVLYLWVYLLVLTLAEYLVHYLATNHSSLLDILVGFQVAASVIFAWSLAYNIKRTGLKLGNQYIKNEDLPTLSVAIPARNETDDLVACLDSLIESDYPKLEILVLDDCSQTKHTPEIIKRYAQSGVRFVEGKEPSSSWTAKNFAYEQLLDQASSDLIMFCGVDARFNSQSLRLMTQLLITKKKRMISFMPTNKIAPPNLIQRLAVQPWRYFWEIALPRKLLRRPPVLSTCWLIYREDLHKMGGFKSVSRNILPERIFARQVAAKNDGYSFMRAGGSQISLSCQKDYMSQLSTAKRTLYPMLGSRPESVLAVCLAKLIALVLPICLLALGLITANYWLAIFSYFNLMTLSLCFNIVARLTYGKKIKGSALLMPFLAVFDTYETLKSMWLYEFKEVIWKDRNVCIPVMRQVGLASLASQSASSSGTKN